MNNISSARFDNDRAFPLWMFLLFGIIFLHFVVVRLPFIPFPIYYLFGIPLFLIALKKFLKNPYRFFTKSAVNFLLIFLVYTLLIAFLNYIHDKSAHLVPRQAYKSLLIYIAIVGLLSNTNQINKIVKFTVVVLALSSLLGLLIFLFGEPFLIIRRVLTSELSAEELKTATFTLEGVHASGLSAHRHYFPYHLCYVLFPCVYFFFQSTKTKRLLWCVVLLIFLVAGLANGERSLLVSWVFGAIYLIFKYYKHYFSPKKLIAGIVIIIMISTISFYALPNNTFKRHMNIQGHVSRYGLLLTGANLFLDYPLGYYEHSGKQYAYYFRMFVNDGSITSLHNDFLAAIVRGGVMGLCLVAAFFLSLIFLIRRRSNIPPENRFFRDTVIAGLIAVLANSLFHNNGFFLGEGTTFLCLGLLCSRGFNKSPTATKIDMFEMKTEISSMKIIDHDPSIGLNLCQKISAKSQFRVF